MFNALSVNVDSCVHDFSIFKIVSNKYEDSRDNIESSKLGHLISILLRRMTIHTCTTNK